MRVLTSSDLHYNIARSRGPTEALAARVCADDADALVLVGDCAGADKRALSDCLALFEGFAGARFFVAGNHSLWDGGADAVSLLRDELPAVAARHGFACLEYQPAVLGPVALVGTVGWYDYSLRNDELAVPMRFYRRKVSPGAARYFTEHRDLLDRRDDLRPEHHTMTTRWMDGVHVKLSISDEQFTEMLAEKLARQLDEVAPRVDRIAVFIHHVPFANLMPRMPNWQWQFVAAFMGSARFGEICRRQPKVSHVVCGHTHQANRAVNGAIDCLSIGSTYVDKQLIELEL